MIMKKYYAIIALSLFLNAKNMAQSITLSPGNISTQKLGFGFVHESMDGLRKLGTYVGGATYGQFETKSFHPLYFTANSFPQLKLSTSGNFAVGGDFEPYAKLHVYGYTKLGFDAPAIATKAIYGTTAATENGVTAILHGLSQSKILSVTLSINTGGGYFISENYKVYNGFQAGVSFDGSYLYIWNSPTNSENILNKVLTAFIVHEE
jgi:hypothetical protein